MTDVEDAYEGLRTNDQIVQLYRSGYLDEAQQDRDISEYAYSAARRACWIIWTRSAATARRSSPTVRRSHPI